MNLITNLLLSIFFAPFVYIAGMFRNRSTVRQPLIFTSMRRVRGGAFNHEKFWPAFDSAISVDDPVTKVEHLITAFANSGEHSTAIFGLMEAYWGCIRFEVRGAKLSTWRTVLDEFGAPQFTNDMWDLHKAEPKAEQHIQKILESRQVATA